MKRIKGIPEEKKSPRWTMAVAIILIVAGLLMIVAIFLPWVNTDASLFEKQPGKKYILGADFQKKITGANTTFFGWHQGLGFFGPGIPFIAGLILMICGILILRKYKVPRLVYFITSLLVLGVAVFDIVMIRTRMTAKFVEDTHFSPAFGLWMLVGVALLVSVLTLVNFIKRDHVVIT